MRRVVTVFGGSGFIGRQVVRRLAANGWIVRVAVRDPVAAGFVRTTGEPGQVNPVHANVTDMASVRAAVAGADAVINLVGILFEKGKARFDAIHRQGAANVAQAARDAGASRLVHMSALGADKNSPSAYARSKAQGEEAVQAAFPGATTIRPSVVFGPDDDFFNRFAKLARVSPVLPVFTGDGFRVIHTENGYGLDLFGSGGPTFQPVYVGDVAEAIVKAVEDTRTAGKVFELGGPRRYTLKETLELILRVTGRTSLLAPLPFWVAKLQAAVLQWLPTPPLTPDQVKLLRVDNVVRGGKPGLVDMGITPVAAEAILPTYLHRYAE
jgi:NADH dehydrogenase